MDAWQPGHEVLSREGSAFEASRLQQADSLTTFLALHAPTLLPHGESLDAAREAVAALSAPAGEVWPGTAAADLVAGEQQRLSTLLDAFERMEQHRAELRPEQQVEMLGGMLLTRTMDAQLGRWFAAKGESEGLVWTAPDGKRYPSPQKGFRSLGQEAVVGVAAALQRGELPDRIGPMIRGLGAALMFGQDPVDILAAQAGKAHGPMGGRDLHIGDLQRGVLPPIAPLALSMGTLAGLGLCL